jgi:uncharacterized C2H2 Zn-finger protein
VFECVGCGKQYKSEKLFTKHVCKPKRATAPQAAAFECRFCKKTFKKETAFTKHSCKTMQRLHQLTSNKQGYELWRYYFTTNHAATNVGELEYVKSAYFTAFERFGTFCKDSAVVHPKQFLAFLLERKYRIDHWCSDAKYQEFYTEFTRQEEPLDAVARSITFMTSQHSTVVEFFTKTHPNRICQALNSGKISPWFMLLSSTGAAFLESLSALQFDHVAETIDPQRWAVLLQRKRLQAADVKKMFAECGI